MQNHRNVAAPPQKPLLVFDGDCRFCTLWIKRWQQTTGDCVDYLPFQDATVAERFPEIPRDAFETSVQLIEPDGRVFGGAHAALRTLAKNPRREWLLRAYERFPAFAQIAEFFYRLVARNRTFFSLMTRWLFGAHVERPTHFLVRWTFLRALGLIYFIAFVSLWTQISGLVGSEGILPTDQFMEGVRQQVSQQNIGLEKYRLLPTLCWLSSSDGFLQFQCAAGTLLAILVIIGIAPAPSLFLLWLIYLSLSTVSRDFYHFQWDTLLLETGWLAIFFAPWRLWPFEKNRSPENPPSRVVLWLLRWLLFRLIFESGCAKLLSGDPTWLNLTALSFHYETQPLPTWISWYMHQLPLWIHQVCCLVMIFIQLVAPFFLFAPRRARFIAAGMIALLQVLILLTGNYTFFNWLALALCLTALDDFALQKFLPLRWRHRVVEHFAAIPKKNIWLRSVAIGAMAIVILTLSLTQVYGMLARDLPLVSLHQWFAPFRSVNTYGLFSTMTTTRPELVIEGSNDGINWLPYEFKHKAGKLSERPKFVAPHQPRLDWQLWFEALRAEAGGRPTPWFIRFNLQLLHGSQPVLDLLEENPFPNAPPRYVRVTLFQYRFTDFAERNQTGAWWKRTAAGEYIRPLSLPPNAPAQRR